MLYRIFQKYRKKMEKSLIRTEEEQSYVALDMDKLKDVLGWFSDNKPSSTECFYQMDTINLNLPELGIAVFQLLVDAGFYVPPKE